MIHYALKCSDDHRFESWFQSAAAFDKLKAAGMVACSVCGSADVVKDVMAPRVSHGTDTAAEKPRPLSASASPAELALKAFKEHIEKNSDYVGGDFAREARAIHDGDAPMRLIHGEAKAEEARRLAEDGVPVSPLPFRALRKSN